MKPVKSQWLESTVSEDYQSCARVAPKITNVKIVSTRSKHGSSRCKGSPFKLDRDKCENNSYNSRNNLFTT